MSVEAQMHDRVLVVRIEREEKRNAVDQAIADGIGAALDRLDDDPELWVGIITGTPTVFSAGSDLASSRDGSARTERGGEYGVIRRDREKPLIAAVEGPALGGGFEIVLACDLVVAARTASFGLPEVKRGLVPTCGGLFRTPRALPLNVAKEMLLTGERLSPERAYSLGFVNVLTEPGEAVAGALALAARMCAVGPVGARASLRALEHTVAERDELGWDETVIATDAVRASDDIREGMAAFFEKREPRWTGK
ncbi:MAG TPA: enoyl-CoA hydratase-related protein [Acidimicrobiia bacterium]|nr:enoyl-CoA hydratase-related protein [Acidimicrobiia bacterium]